MRVKGEVIVYETRCRQRRRSEGKSYWKRISRKIELKRCCKMKFSSTKRIEITCGELQVIY